MRRYLESHGENEASYLNALQNYLDLDGFDVDFKIERELNLIGLSKELLIRPYSTLSGGEQTKVQIIALFLKPNHFILLDEPTNHLDADGIEILGEYLKRKNGFIVVSHHREFLDTCVDHILSLTKAGIHIEHGNYSSWEYNYDLKKAFEQEKREKIEIDIKRLEQTAAQKREWSKHKEKQKIGAGDKGYIGHKAAKLMKRALAVENRIEQQIQEKKTLVAFNERTQAIKINCSHPVEKILDVTHLRVSLGETIIIPNLSFSLQNRERIAITGKNGCGKSTLIKALLNDVPINSGLIRIDNRVKIAYSGQFPRFSHGLLRERLNEEGIDETKFRSILGAMCCHREIYERDLSTFSLGELKKVDLAYCLYEEVHLLIWDEPLNGLDIESRRSLEQAILKYEPTLLFVEHDATFVNQIATRKLSL
ncbi:MAG: ATP-binding cassette domain-containing protein, partial [Turicibacter sp.]